MREEKESCLFSRHYIYMSVNQNAQAMNEMSLNQEGDIIAPIGRARGNIKAWMFASRGARWPERGIVVALS
jgi:hypothetical protein